MKDTMIEYIFFLEILRTKFIYHYKFQKNNFLQKLKNFSEQNGVLFFSLFLHPFAAACWALCHQLMKNARYSLRT